MKVNICSEQTRKATGKRSSFTKKHIIIGTISIIAIMLTVVAYNLFYGKKFNSDNAGREVRIEWEEVNLRKGPSTSKKVIATLFRGSSVTLTGNSYDYLGNGIATDSWTEVELKDGTTGWVVNASIKWT